MWWSHCRITVYHTFHMTDDSSLDQISAFIKKVMFHSMTQWLTGHETAPWKQCHHDFIHPVSAPYFLREKWFKIWKTVGKLKKSADQIYVVKACSWNWKKLQQWKMIAGRDCGRKQQSQRVALLVPRQRVSGLKLLVSSGTSEWSQATRVVGHEWVVSIKLLVSSGTGFVSEWAHSPLLLFSTSVGDPCRI